MLQQAEKYSKECQISSVYDTDGICPVQVFGIPHHDRHTDRPLRPDGGVSKRLLAAAPDIYSIDGDISVSVGPDYFTDEYYQCRYP